MVREVVLFAAVEGRWVGVGSSASELVSLSDATLGVVMMTEGVCDRAGVVMDATDDGGRVVVAESPDTVPMTRISASSDGGSRRRCSRRIVFQCRVFLVILVAVLFDAGISEGLLDGMANQITSPARVCEAQL